MPGPSRIIDPYYDDNKFARAGELGAPPQDWTSRPPWQNETGHAALQSTTHRTMTTMVRGQIMCADAVVRDILSRDDDAGSYMAVPAIGFARLAVEIAMKDTLKRAMLLQYATGPVTAGNVFTTHDVEKLAAGMRVLLERPDGDKVKAAWALIEPHLKWWQRHDPKNELGRYAVDRHGRPVAPPGNIDASHLLSVATAVFSIWYALSAWLDAMEENAAENDEYNHE